MQMINMRMIAVAIFSLQVFENLRGRLDIL